MFHLVLNVRAENSYQEIIRGLCQNESQLPNLVTQGA
jgi:hypothetical protein